jgi:hypothetical protein
MILHGMGKEAQINRITKRVADEVCWHSARNPWRRSPLWLVLRVAIQTTTDSRDTYKEFMVFFQTRLLRLFLRHGLSSELLYAARVKTSRRVYKLGASASPRLLEAVGAVGREIEARLQARWSEEQPYKPVLPPTPQIPLPSKRTRRSHFLNPGPTSPKLCTPILTHQTPRHSIHATSLVFMTLMISTSSVLMA